MFSRQKPDGKFRVRHENKCASCRFQSEQWPKSTNAIREQPRHLSCGVSNGGGWEHACVGGSKWRKTNRACNMVHKHIISQGGETLPLAQSMRAQNSSACAVVEQCSKLHEVSTDSQFGTPNGVLCYIAQCLYKDLYTCPHCAGWGGSLSPRC